MQVALEAMVDWGAALAEAAAGAPGGLVSQKKMKMKKTTSVPACLRLSYRS